MAGEAVLLVDNEDSTRTFLEQQLTDDGFDVVAVDRGGPALELLERGGPDLVLLDVVLPDASGFEVCRRLREGEPGRAWNRDIPVIMVSERGEPIDRVRGFARGADDFVVRPFVYEELVARMRAVLRRSAGYARREHVRVGEIDIDRLARTVRVSGESVVLSTKEYELLLMLTRHPGRSFSRGYLLDHIWGADYEGGDRTVDTQIVRLRRKLGEVGERISTVWGVGYRFE